MSVLFPGVSVAGFNGNGLSMPGETRFATSEPMQCYAMLARISLVEITLA